MKKLYIVATALMLFCSCHTVRVHTLDALNSDSLTVRTANLAEVLALQRMVELESVTIVISEPRDSQQIKKIIHARRMKLKSSAEQTTITATTDSARCVNRTIHAVDTGQRPHSILSELKKSLISCLLIGLILLTLYRYAKRRR